MKKIFLPVFFVVLFSSGSHLLFAQDSLSRKISFGINSQFRVRSFDSERNRFAFAAGPLVKLNKICRSGWDIETGIIFSQSRFTDTRYGFCAVGYGQPMTIDYQYLEFPLIFRHYASGNRQAKTQFVIDLGLQSAILVRGIEKEYEIDDSNGEFIETSRKTYDIFNGSEKLNRPGTNLGAIVGLGIVTRLEKLSFHLAARLQIPAILEAESAHTYGMSSAGLTLSPFY